MIIGTKRWLRIATMLLFAAMVSGCVNRVTANKTPGTTLKGRGVFLVLHQPQDDNGIDDLIAGRLVAMGYQASVGPDDSAVPPGTDVVVTYIDKWMWDFTTYLFELTITLKDAKTQMPLASGSALHGSLTRRSPSEMVDEVLTEIFGSSGGG